MKRCPLSPAVILGESAKCPTCLLYTSTELMGAETFLYLNVEGFSFTARVEPTSTARPSDNIDIVIDNTKIHLFDKETEQTICN